MSRSHSIKYLYSLSRDCGCKLTDVNIICDIKCDQMSLVIFQILRLMSQGSVSKSPTLVYP